MYVIVIYNDDDEVEEVVGPFREGYDAHQLAYDEARGRKYEVVLLTTPRVKSLYPY